MNNNKRKVMVFGVFDGIHDGHRFFLNEAGFYGDDLVIVVTLDDTVKWLKDKSPVYTLGQRIKALEKEYPKAEVIPGDNRSNVWNVIKENKPDLIVLGYDQGKMEQALHDIKLNMDIEVIKIKKDHNGKTLHSSLLRKNN